MYRIRLLSRFGALLIPLASRSGEMISHPSSFFLTDAVVRVLGHGSVALNRASSNAQIILLVLVYQFVPSVMKIDRFGSL